MQAQLVGFRTPTQFFGISLRSCTFSSISRGWTTGPSFKEAWVPSSYAVEQRLTDHGGCLHMPAYACAHNDFSLMEALLADVTRCGDALAKHASGRHSVVYGDALKDSVAFRGLVARLLETFRMKLIDCWVNVYQGTGDTKAMHYDNYYDRRPRPTVTLGLSLGETRDLAFRHGPTGQVIRVAQKNGDIFAFDEPFNKYFMHGVPPAQRARDGGVRLSVIVWATDRPVLQGVARTNLPAHVPQHVSWMGWDLRNISNEAIVRTHQVEQAWADAEADDEYDCLWAAAEASEGEQALAGAEAWEAAAASEIEQAWAAAEAYKESDEEAATKAVAQKGQPAESSGVDDNTGEDCDRRGGEEAVPMPAPPDDASELALDTNAVLESKAPGAALDHAQQACGHRHSAPRGGELVSSFT
eukprot:CAMPEP_0117539354 /NCGR_PEP_ID=MMETSP0784-20121206/42942_1 /TAXON_ID=39447 /ORGANISM="" /LENGTH=412 /DNA_ID=CAMNT_0005335979 /DNA_START=87 /DNA_END=1323 /DNA_ORIENTATION=+